MYVLLLQRHVFEIDHQFTGDMLGNADISHFPTFSITYRLYYSSFSNFSLTDEKECLLCSKAYPKQQRTKALFYVPCVYLKAS